jgi:uncharacterized RDD family membrane protein YckC
VASPPSEHVELRLRIGQEVFRLAVDRIVIGRSRSCDLRLRADTVSRLHACITRRAGRMLIEDMGSSNGTFLNGRLVIGEQPLQAGDVVRFGTLKTAVELASAPIPTPSEDPLIEVDYTIGLIDAAEAPLGARLLAALLDALLFSAGSLVPFAPLIATWAIERYLLASTVSAPGRAVSEVILYGCLGLWLIYACYYFVHGWAKRGGTPGMRLCDLRLADDTNHVPAGWRRALMRLLGVGLGLLTLGIGFLLPLVRSDRKTLQDLVAGTHVVRRRPALGAATSAA